jgi:diketogulonate reductase-like aldo/keto reductase
LTEINLIDRLSQQNEGAEIQGVSVPKLGFGTWRLRGDACYQSVLDALELGYRHIDTAEMYENQNRVGEAMRDSGVAREDVFLTTKVWKTDLRPEDVHKSCEQSLEQLHVEDVDLLLIHWPNPKIPLGETLAAFNELKTQGKTRHIGVSNFPLDLLQNAQELSQVRIFCDQVAYHIREDRRSLVCIVRSKIFCSPRTARLPRGRFLMSGS